MSAEVRRRLITLGAASVGVAGAAFGAHPARLAWQAQHLEPLQLVFRGRCSTWSPSGSFCMAGAALGAPPQRSAQVWRRLITLGRLAWFEEIEIWNTYGHSKNSFIGCSYVKASWIVKEIYSSMSG